MRKSRRMTFAFCVAASLVLSGCDWEASNNSDSWNSADDFVNFSGVYQPASGQTYLVSTYAPSSSTPASIQTSSDALSKSPSGGTGGNGIDSTFAGTLSHTPVAKGSVSVTDGTESFTDPDGSGKLTGNKGGTGSINYQTGAITVTFMLAPAVGQSVIVSYAYDLPGTTANPASGSSVPIYALTVVQQGNVLTFTDSNGKTYNGYLGGISTPTGSASSNILVSTTITANFEVSGTDASGQKVTITGAFTGDYTSGTSLTSGSSGGGGGGTLANRGIQGTWIYADGSTASLAGTAGGTSSVSQINSNNTTTVVGWWY